MSFASALAAVEYEAETTWGEATATFAAHRIPIVGALDTNGLVQAKQDSDRSQQFLQGGSQHILGVKGGSFKMKLWLAGHGVTTAGAVTLDAMETFLGYVFGNPSLTTGVILSAAASTTATAGTAAAPTTAASATFTAGTLCRIGAMGDTRGGAQFYPIGTHVGTTLSLLLAMLGAPTNGDIVYPCSNFFFPESTANSAVKGLRFRLLTANQRYECHGCWPMSATISGLNPGEIPAIEIEWGVSWWIPVATGTFPSAVASNAYNPAPVAAGSLLLQDVGVTTNNAAARRICRSFSIQIQLGIVPLQGPGAVADAFQVIVGAVRTPSQIKVSWMEDAEAAGTATLDAKFLAATPQQAMFTASCTAGSALGFYFRSLVICGKRPVQQPDNSINRTMIEAYAYTGPVTTTDPQAAAFMMGMS